MSLNGIKIRIFNLEKLKLFLFLFLMSKSAVTKMHFLCVSHRYGLKPNDQILAEEKHKEM